MKWRLMKMLFPPGRLLLFAAVFVLAQVAFIVFMRSIVSDFSPFGVITITAATPLLWFASGLYRRATEFEMALPLTGRQLISARILLTVAITGLPPLLALGYLALLGALDVEFSSLLIRSTAAVTLAITAAFAYRTRTLLIPAWLGFATFVGAVAFTVAVRAKPFLPTVAVCLAASASLLAFAWLRAPASFQLAGQSIKSRRRSKALPNASNAFRFLPIARTIYPGLLYLLLVEPLVFSVTNQNWSLPATIAAATFVRSAPTTPFLLSLPISPGRLLAARLVPTLSLLTITDLLTLYYRT